VEVERKNQVWSTDITYIPVVGGTLYLVAVVDWYSRHIISWSLSNTLTTKFCLDALDKALEKGSPEIFNTDQGSQFTSREFTDRLKSAGIKISMDGKGRATDNAIMERIWRSLKYEQLYGVELTGAAETRAAIKAWIEYYNNERPHLGLAGKTPAQVYHQN
jgi:putative transposase